LRRLLSNFGEKRAIFLKTNIRQVGVR
jgi:hypothetical protein